ncbi:MAG: hypothetical protein IT267_00950 [Saprospiraceae bacterium]|nr:hypothetical protein [Saprospiraceae bacterium]
MNTKLKLGILISIYLLTMIFVALIWMNTIQMQNAQKPKQLMVNIYKPSIENMMIQEQEIVKYVKEYFKKDWKKIPIEKLNVSGLESTLEKIQVVHHSEVYLDALENLHVDVYQRDPLFRVMTPFGDQFYIDVEGKKIPSSISYSARVPVVTGVESVFLGNDIWKKENAAYKDVFQVVNEITKDKFTRSLIEQIDLDHNGEFTLIPKIGYEKIEIGNSENMFEKLDKLRFFYQEGLRYQGWNVYQVLNLRVKDQIIGVKNINKS